MRRERCCTYRVMRPTLAAVEEKKTDQRMHGVQVHRGVARGMKNALLEQCFSYYGPDEFGDKSNE